MLGQHIRVATTQYRGEISLRVQREKIFERLLGVDQTVVQVDLRVAENNGKFWTCETELAIATLINLCLVWQKLDFPIQKAAALKVCNKCSRFIDAGG